MNTVLNILFGLFLLYTWLYVLQWLAGLIASMDTLAKSGKRKLLARWTVPPELAARNPVSVVIAAHNEESCVTDTIDSLLEEDYPDMEIILVDDGSTDRMAHKVLEHYHMEPAPHRITGKLAELTGCSCYEQTVHSRKLVFLRKENGGKAHALNCGLELSAGRYCLVLDADTRVERGSIRIMVSRFLSDPRTVVCAGVVGNNNAELPKLPLLRKCLVMFQSLEYFRTFYMQRILLDRFNANLVVSGAFAMFDAKLLKEIGGYREDTIGEDMELSMRLHAFCLSQNREYRIAYTPDAKCTTQLPMRYRDFFRQRRRWQIGMIQSMRSHAYMLLNRHYGFAGVLSGFIFLMYELLAPFAEIIGTVTLIAAYFAGILKVSTACGILLGYYVLMVLMELLLITVLRVYGAEKMPLPRFLDYLMLACVEFVSFHMIQSYVKIAAVVTYRKHSRTWQHIRRTREMAQK